MTCKSKDCECDGKCKVCKCDKERWNKTLNSIINKYTATPSGYDPNITDYAQQVSVKEVREQQISVLPGCRGCSGCAGSCKK